MFAASTARLTPSPSVGSCSPTCSRFLAELQSSDYGSRLSFTLVVDWNVILDYCSRDRFRYHESVSRLTIFTGDLHLGV